MLEHAGMLKLCIGMLECDCLRQPRWKDAVFWGGGGQRKRQRHIRAGGNLSILFLIPTSHWKSCPCPWNIRLWHWNMCLCPWICPVRETQHAKSKHKQLFHNKEPPKPVTCVASISRQRERDCGNVEPSHVGMLECWIEALKVLAASNIYQQPQNLNTQSFGAVAPGKIEHPAFGTTESSFKSSVTWLCDSSSFLLRLAFSSATRMFILLCSATSRRRHSKSAMAFTACPWHFSILSRSMIFSACSFNSIFWNAGVNGCPVCFLHQSTKLKQSWRWARLRVLDLSLNCLISC